MTGSRRTIVALACAATLSALLWSLGHLRYASGCEFWRAAMNFGHVPLFSLVALALLGLSLSALGERLQRSRHLFLALACTVVVAGASELLQVYTGRTVEAQDYLRNLAGGGGTLAIWAALDRRMRNGAPWTLPSFRRFVVALAFGAVLLSFVPVARNAEAHRRMYSRQPVLAHFDSAWELPFLSTEYTGFDLVPAPADWKGFSERLVARAIFRTWRYPRVSLHDFHIDWDDYAFLEMDLYLEADHAEKLALRVNDIRHGRRHEDWFVRRIELQPGPNRLRVPLAEIRSAPRGRQMDMSAIGEVILFADHPRQRIRVYLADWRLAAE